MFNEYNEKYELFHKSEDWLIGNETKFYNGKLDYDKKKSELLSCKLMGDTDCTDRIMAEGKIKNEEYMKTYNMTVEQFMVCAKAKLENSRKDLESSRIKLNEATIKVDKITGYLWIILNCLFVLGGMYGAYKSKKTLDYFGRKNAILFHYLFTIVGSVLVFISLVIKSPICLGFSRFLFGVQGG